MMNKTAKDVFRMYYISLAKEFYANEYKEIGNLLEPNEDQLIEKVKEEQAIWKSRMKSLRA